MPVTFLADGHDHVVFAPVGIHPDWSADVRNARLVLPADADGSISLVQVERIKRSPFALDAVLGRVLAPLLPALPDGQALAMLAGALLSAAVAASLPSGLFGGRLSRAGLLAIACGVLCAVPALATVAEQVRLTATLWNHYALLDRAELDLRAPHYADSPAINRLLVQAATQLPDGPVLVMSEAQIPGYLDFRAHYLLFPRPVQFARDTQRVQLDGVDGLIQTDRRAPPGPDWVRVAGPAGGWVAWARSGSEPPTPIPMPGQDAWVRLLLAIAVVLLAGYGLAGVLGWRGLERVACSLPFGAGLLAGWMSGQSVLGVAWSPLSTGVPLAVAGLSMTLAVKPRRSEGSEGSEGSESSAWIWPVAVALVVMVVAACALLQAGAQPFTDQDSWTTWGFNGRAFYVSGNIRDALARYAPGGLTHPTYPPLWPLMQAWAYRAMGGVDERLAKLIMPMWYASLVLLVWCGCRRWTSVPVAAALTLLVATTPLFLDHAALGNADLPFSVVLLAAAMALGRWLVERERRWFASGVLALGIVAWIKLDGVYLGLVLLMATGIAFGVAAHQRQLTKASWLGGIALVLAGAVALLVIYAPWLMLANGLGVESETPNLAKLSAAGLTTLWRGLVVIGSEMLVSYNNSVWGLLGGGYGLLWIAGIGAIVIGLLKGRREATLVWLVLAIAGAIAFYALIYAVRPYFSVERYLMHVVPLLSLAMAVALGRPAGSASPATPASRPYSQ